MNTPDILRAENAAANERDLAKPMAPFAVRDLSVLAYANGFTLWHFKAKCISDLLASNYFGDCADMMSPGDHIHVSAPDGAALLNVDKTTSGVVIVRKLAA